MSLVCKDYCVSPAHVRNEARLRGIKKGLVNSKCGQLCRWCKIYVKKH